MRAVVCTAWGGPETLLLQDLPDPTPGPGEVLVQILAAGVNFPDVLIIQKKYQVQPELPFIPGAEISGRVLALGEGWHNTHHAFPTSARHGLRWWQFDVSYYVIRALAWLRLAWNVRLPSRQAQAAQRS